MTEPSSSSLKHASSKSSAMPSLLFRNRNFMLLWAAYGVSAMGDHIAEMAVLAFMDAMSDPNVTGLYAMITFMFFLPYFLLGPVNGMLADRLPRRGLMISADLARAAIFLGFGILLNTFAPLGRFGPFVPFLLVGIFAAMFSPARQALLPTLIHPGQLVRANAMSGGLGVIAAMLATLLGGYLADNFNPQVAFNVDAGTFLLSAALLLFIRPPADAKTAPTHKPVGLGAFVEGFKYLCTHRRVAQLIAVAVVIWMCGSTVLSTLPALVRDIYNHPEYTEIAIFRAAWGVGLLTGAILLTLLGNALRSEIAITWSLLGAGAAIGTLALSVFLPLPEAIRYRMGLTAIAIAGLFGAGVMASYAALLQRIVPNRLRGRIFGLADICTIAGLLLATGTLGIPSWANLDRWIGWIIAGCAAMAIIAGAASLLIRLRSNRFGLIVGFWWNVTEFICKGWYRLKREGHCTVPVDGPVMVVANHTSPVDPLLLIASCPLRVISFMIAVEFSKIPFGRYLIELIECIPVDRKRHDTGATRAAMRHLKENGILGIFIEGRIAKPGEIIEPKDGPVMIALKTNTPIVPAHISGTNYHDSIFISHIMRHRARVRYGPPINVRELVGDRDDKDAIREASRHVMAKIRELGPVEKQQGFPVEML